MSYRELVSNVSILSTVEDHSAPPSPLQEQKEEVEEDEGDEETGALRVRLYMCDPLAPASNPSTIGLNSSGQEDESHVTFFQIGRKCDCSLILKKKQRNENDKGIFHFRWI